MKKPKSILRTQLTELQQAQLADWLIGGMQYHEVVPVIEKEFGLKLGGGWKNQLSHFWEQVCVPHQLNRRHEAVATAEEIANDARQRPGQFHAATIDRLGELCLRLAMAPGANPKDLKSVYGLLLKARDQDLSERQLALDRHKFEAQFLDLVRKAASDARMRELVDRKADNTEIIAYMRQTYFADIDALEKSGTVQLPK